MWRHMRWRGVVIPLFHPWFCDEEHMLKKVNSEVALKSGKVISVQSSPIFESSFRLKVTTFRLRVLQIRVEM